MRVDVKATKRARMLHAAGVAKLNALFLFDPLKPPKAKRRHAAHDSRWRRRKIAAASRRRNRS